MQELTIEELKERIIAQVDQDTLLEILDLRMEDLVEALSYHIEMKYVKVVQAVDS